MPHAPVLITLDYPPEHGGVARYLGEFVKASGNAIDVVVESDHERTGPGKSVIARGFFRMSWPKWWPLVGVCREFRHAPYLIVSHVLPVGTAAMIAKWTGGAPYILMCHGLDVKMATRNGWKRMLFRAVCRHAHAVLSNSDATRALIQEAVPGADIVVLAPGVSDHESFGRGEARSRLGIDDGEFIILSVARFMKRKGLDTLLEASKRIDRPRLRFVIAGYGPEEPVLEELAAESPHRVDIIKEPSDRDVALWYAAADLFALPVREPRRDVEGYGIVFLEAARSGLPVVAGKTGGVTEAVQDGVTGVLVEPDQPEALARVIAELIDDPSRRNRMGKAGRDRVLRDFRWEDRWKRFQSIITGL
jgi:phosphatidylinositol alpha-1,6-mannosyltransferase